jgi:hypothetical protein
VLALAFEAGEEVADDVGAGVDEVAGGGGEVSFELRRLGSKLALDSLHPAWEVLTHQSHGIRHLRQYSQKQ